MNRIKITISSEFTDAPGARYITDGPKSGEEFYNELLRPRFLEAKEKNGKLLVDLDNTWGYASSFISGSFGRLSREFGQTDAIKHLDLKSEDDPLLKTKILDEIKKQYNEQEDITNN